MTEPRFPRFLERFDQFDPEFVENYFDVCAELRERCPVTHSEAHEEFWVLTRFEDVMNGFGDDAGLSTTPSAAIPPNPNATPLVPLQLPPEPHAEFRRFLMPFFRASEVAGYEQGIRETVTRAIDGFIERGHCEFITEFARRLPGEVVLRQVLGLPDADIERAYEYTLTIMHGQGTPEIEVVHQRFRELITGLLERKRREPRSDHIVDALLHETVGGRPLDEDTILNCLVLLISAGLDTTAYGVGHMVIRLARDPELRRRLEADPSLHARAIEEFLRLEPPAGGLVRTAMHDMEIRGKTIRAGERVLLLVSAANRDPREFEGPDEVNLHRELNRHLAFGYGARFCLGVHLARLELRVALEEILARLHDLCLTDDHIEYDDGVLRGPAHVNVAFTPGPRLLDVTV